MNSDPRPNYINISSQGERRDLDYAPFRRQLSHSLKPASIIGPALVIVLLGAAGLLAYVVYVLAVPVTP